MIRPFNKIYPDIKQNVYVDEQASVIGDVLLGDDVSVWPMAVIRGDVNYIRIQAKTNIQDGSVLHVTHEAPHQTGYPLIIGEGVTIGHNVVLHGCTIEDYCLIGMGSTILDGAILQKNVLLGAGSLVTPGKILESGYLWMGSPAQKKRPLTVAEIANFKYSADHYIEVKNQFIGVGSNFDH